MPAKFRIRSHGNAWIVDYPDGYPSEYTCTWCPSFDAAVERYCMSLGLLVIAGLAKPERNDDD